VLREMMYVCRPAGVLSVPGVYGGLLDKIPFGMVMNKSLTIRTGGLDWLVVTQSCRDSRRGPRCGQERMAAARGLMSPIRPLW
jgi:threonine dehydrogenase-like Zn-dependent dehydrogenase